MADMMTSSTGLADLARSQMQAGEAILAGNRMKSAAAQSGEDGLRKVAKEFEAMFLNQMLEHMSSGIKTDGLFGGGQGEAMFRSLLNQQYANGISSRGGLGIADHVYRQMLAMQEK